MQNEEQSQIYTPLANEAAALNLTMSELANTAMRIKSERDEAVKLLRHALEISEMGRHGPFKTAVREYLRRISK